MAVCTEAALASPERRLAGVVRRGSGGANGVTRLRRLRRRPCPCGEDGTRAALQRSTRGGDMKFAVGQPLRRFEDFRLITGKGRYTDDIVLPGMVHAYVLRSPAAHARITRIDAAAARGMPGVLLLLTGEDVTA